MFAAHWLARRCASAPPCNSEPAAAPQPPPPRHQERGSYDVVFSNWLLMYLSDAEVQALAVKILDWVSSSLHPWSTGQVHNRPPAGACFRHPDHHHHHHRAPHQTAFAQWHAVFPRELLQAER